MIAAAEAGAGGDVEAQNELVAAFGSRLNFGTAGMMCCEDTRRVAHCLTMCVRSLEQAFVAKWELAPPV